ncbi:MAG: hypothetical protein WD708_12755 [Kiritimatiellia bacterium]
MKFYDLYRTLPKKPGFDDENVIEKLIEVVAFSHECLERTDILDLTSMVEEKTYFAFGKQSEHTRAVNAALFISEKESVTDRLGVLLREPFSNQLDSEEITRVVYSAAMLFCCANDLRTKNDQKTPGTFFEYLIRILFSVHLGCAAQTSLPVMNMDEDCWLPTDLVYDLGAKKPKFHIPVKTSTRERIIQVWAHQRVVDGAYGVGRFLGLPCIMAETKVDSRKKEVVEICLPNQWRLYQLFIAQLWGVCYLDLPAKYEALNHVYPLLRIKTAGDFLEKDGILETFLKSIS